MAGQWLSIEGIANARQLGGYEGFGGKRVKEGLLIRSGKLENITPSGLESLKKLNVTKILDLRSCHEIEKHRDPESLAPLRKEIRMLDENEETTSHDNLVFMKFTGGLEALIREYENGLRMHNIYVSLVRNEYSASKLSEALKEVISMPEGEAVLWHCNGGKDRTGVLAYFILTILGVSEEDIKKDFLLSNEFYENNISEVVKAAEVLTDDPEILRLMPGIAGVLWENIEKVAAYTIQKSGSTMDYIKNCLGITDGEINIMREKYLQ